MYQAHKNKLDVLSYKKKGHESFLKDISQKYMWDSGCFQQTSQFIDTTNRSVSKLFSTNHVSVQTFLGKALFVGGSFNSAKRIQ